MGNSPSCNEQAARICDILIQKGYNIPERPKRHCFRLNICDESNFDIAKDKNLPVQVSISYPPDAMGNRGTEYKEPVIPQTLETALIDTNGELIYLDDWGYDDICRFSSEEFVISEIERLLNKINTIINEIN